jgi:hypothetical protein
MDRNIQRSNTRFMWLSFSMVAIGSVTPDIGHGLHLLFPAISWSCTHYWTMFCLILSITLLVGFVTNYILRRV